MIGNIPENLVFIFSEKTKVNDIEVIPAYVSDATNKKTIETGESWASGRYYHKEKNIHQNVFLPNTPFVGPRILDLVIRSEGGRAYKLLLPMGYYVDFREAELMDAIENVGIRAGGYLNGEWIFARVASQMKPIRVGSKIHSEMIKSTEIGKSKSIKELEIGHCYKQKNEEQKVFLGRVNSLEVHWILENNYGQRIPKIEYLKLIKNGYLWFDRFYWNIPEKIVEDFNDPKDHYFKITRSHVVKEDLGIMISDIDIPSLRDKIKSCITSELPDVWWFHRNGKFYNPRESVYYMQPVDQEYIIPEELRGYKINE